MSKPAALVATLAALAALGPAGATAKTAHHAKTIHVTAEVVKSFRSHGTPSTRVALDLSAKGKKVGTTKSALTCNGLAITFIT
jgi:hypothetical protein